MHKLSNWLSKEEICQTVEAITAASTTGTDSTLLDVNREGREELLGGEQTIPNDGVVHKLSDWLSKEEICQTVEAITAAPTTSADFAHLTVNEAGNCEVNMDSSVPSRRASLGRPPRRAHRGGLGEDGIFSLEETYVDDVDVGEAKLSIGEESEEEGEERGGRRGDGGADFCSPPPFLSIFYL